MRAHFRCGEGALGAGPDVAQQEGALWRQVGLPQLRAMHAVVRVEEPPAEAKLEPAYVVERVSPRASSVWRSHALTSAFGTSALGRDARSGDGGWAHAVAASVSAIARLRLRRRATEQPPRTSGAGVSKLAI